MHSYHVQRHNIERDMARLESKYRYDQQNYSKNLSKIYRSHMRHVASNQVEQNKAEDLILQHDIANEANTLRKFTEHIKLTQSSSNRIEDPDVLITIEQERQKRTKTISELRHRQLELRGQLNSSQFSFETSMTKEDKLAKEKELLTSIHSTLADYERKSTAFTHPTEETIQSSDSSEDSLPDKVSSHSLSHHSTSLHSSHSFPHHTASTMHFHDSFTGTLMPAPSSRTDALHDYTSPLLHFSNLSSLESSPSPSSVSSIAPPPSASPPKRLPSTERTSSQSLTSASLPSLKPSPPPLPVSSPEYQILISPLFNSASRKQKTIHKNQSLRSSSLLGNSLSSTDHPVSKSPH